MLDKTTSHRIPHVNFSPERESHGSTVKSQVDKQEPGVIEVETTPFRKCLRDCMSSQCVRE
ncbi:hypothetical protein HanIR_Chr11g0507761 [Helianthus annuus]|nr:hypothetical protein HanIR_Chr11g0507761 [Helianthus annuus]